MPLPPVAPDESTVIELADDGEMAGLIGELPGLTWLELAFKLAKAAFYADAGFTVKTEQCVLKETDAESLIRAGFAKEPCAANSGLLEERCAPEECLESLAAGFAPCLFRAPTENDGLKNFFSLAGDERAHWYWEGKAAIPWVEMDLLHVELKEDESFADVAKSRGCFAGKAGELYAGKGAAAKYKGARLGRFEFAAKKVQIDAAGKRPLIKCRAVFDIAQNVPELPRIGLEARIPASFGKVRLLANGPHECYTDRKEGAMLCRYELAPDEFEVPYVLPQASGNRTGVRALSLISGEGAASFRFAKECQVSASRYTEENLFSARHTCDLVDTTQAGNGGFWTLHIDCAHRGVGTGACGPDTLEQYRVRPGFYEMVFYLY